MLKCINVNFYHLTFILRLPTNKNKFLKQLYSIFFTEIAETMTLLPPTHSNNSYYFFGLISYIINIVNFMSLFGNYGWL